MSRNACTNRSSIVLMSFEKNPMRFFSFSLLCVVGAEPRLPVLRAHTLVVSNVPGRRSVPRLQAPHGRNSHTQFRGIPSGRCEIGTTGGFSFRQMTGSQFAGTALTVCWHCIVRSRLERSSCLCRAPYTLHDRR